jgi:hypothetical protein
MTQHIKTHFKQRGINSLTCGFYNSLTAASSDGLGLAGAGVEEPEVKEEWHSHEENEDVTEEETLDNN